MDNYDIRYHDKYGRLTHIDLAAEGAAHDPWFNQTLTTVNDCVVRLAVIFRSQFRRIVGTTPSAYRLTFQTSHPAGQTPNRAA